jgi:hypothetical protein
MGSWEEEVGQTVKRIPDPGYLLFSHSTYNKFYLGFDRRPGAAFGRVGVLY